MLLSANLLTNVQTVNSFQFTSQITLNQGDTQNIYIQLKDASQNTLMGGWNPSGLRYMPAPNSTVTVGLTNIDDALSIVGRPSTQPYPTSDPSIWYMPLLASDSGLCGTCDLIITLIQNGVQSTARIPAAVLIICNANCGC